MHTSLEDVLWPNIYLLSIVGIWPLPSNSNIATRFFTHFRLFIHITCFSLLIITLFYTISVNWGDLSILADLGNVMFNSILVLFKLIYVIIRRKACHRMLDHLQKFWLISHKAKERQSFECFAIVAKIVTIACAVVAFGDILLYTGPSIITYFRYRLSDNRTDLHPVLPLDIPYGFDYQQSPIFEFMLILQLLMFLCSFAAIVGSDCTIMTVILHVTGQFRFINGRFQAIGNEIYLHNLDHAFAIMEIRRCIEHHKQIVRAAEELNDLVGPMAGVHILTLNLIICLSGFSVIKGNSSKAEIIKFAIVFISVIIHLILWCWPGELLIQESSTVAQTVVSEIPWFIFPIRVQRHLSFVILRAQKESNIASFLQVMCIRKITEVCHTAASFMTLLRSMQD